MHHPTPKIIPSGLQSLKMLKTRKSKWQDRIFIKYLKGTDFLIFEDVKKT